MLRESSRKAFPLQAFLAAVPLRPEPLALHVSSSRGLGFLFCRCQTARSFRKWRWPSLNTGTPPKHPSSALISGWRILLPFAKMSADQHVNILAGSLNFTRQFACHMVATNKSHRQGGLLKQLSWTVPHLRVWSLPSSPWPHCPDWIRASGLFVFAKPLDTLRALDNSRSLVLSSLSWFSCFHHFHRLRCPTSLCPHPLPPAPHILPCTYISPGKDSDTDIPAIKIPIRSREEHW